MVGPVSESERVSFRRKLKAAITVLVAVSTTLVAVQAEASLPYTAGAGVVGLLVGGLVAWYVVPSGPMPADRGPTQAVDDPFADGGGEAETDTERGREAAERTRHE